MTPRRLYRLPALLIRERRASGERPRVPEPMVMDDPESVAGFHEGGETGIGLRSAYDLCSRALSKLLPEGGRLLDLGCGSGRFLAFFAERRPDVTIVGFDLSRPMLETGREMLVAAGLAKRVRLEEADITSIPEQAASKLDAVSAILTLHQLPDDALRGCLREMARLRERHGCALWIYDFARLRDARVFPALYDVIDPDIPAALRADAIASEAAAFTVPELRAELEAAGLGDLRGGAMKPLPVSQIHWTRGVHTSTEASAKEEWIEPNLPGPVRRDAALARLGFRGLLPG